MTDLSRAGLFCDWAWLPDGWAANVRIAIDDAGRIAAVTPDARAQPGDRRLVDRLVVPAPGNLHSHAFQRAMAGHAERKESGDDSFWTWRETMYAFLDRLTPEDIEAIAAYAYMEILEAGYAAVGEFHYLHHAPDGASYDDPAETAHRIAAAARTAGIGLTLLPVLYAQGGVDGTPLNDRQRRFGCDGDRFAALVDAIRLPMADARLGVAAHSLRAVPPPLLAMLPTLRPDDPVHIHIAEQTAEVDAVEAAYGARPVAWLLDNADIDTRWCAVHATHMTPAETEGLARSGAVAGLCPLTEADLGDGIFDGARYLAAGGAYGIGSDSHIRIGLTEELRVLEYSQRLRDRRRCILRAGEGSLGEAMVAAAARGGAQALARGSGRIEAGAWADLAALDADAILPFVPGPDQWLDHWVFVAGDAALREVWSAGRLTVEGGRHLRRGPIARAFKETLARLMEAA